MSRWHGDPGLVDNQGGLPHYYFTGITAPTDLNTQVAWAMIASMILVLEALPGWILFRFDLLDELLLELLGLNVGTLLGLVIVEIIPDVYGKVTRYVLKIEVVTFLFLAGISLPFFMEKFIRKGQGSKFRKLATKAGYINKGVNVGHGGHGPAASPSDGGKVASFTADVPTSIALSGPGPVDETGSTDPMARLPNAVEFHLDDGATKSVVVVPVHEIGQNQHQHQNNIKPHTLVMPDGAGSRLSLHVGPSSSPTNASVPVGSSVGSPKSKKEAKIAAAIAKGEDLPLMIVMLFSDVIDNFVDGGVIAAGWITGNGVGLATTIAVFLDILPNLTSSYAVFVQAGCSEKKALFLNIIAAFPLVLGSGTICAIASNPSVDRTQVAYLLPFAAGSFMYMCMADLIPIINNSWTTYTRAFTQFLSFGLGLFMQISVRLYAISEGANS